MEDLVKFIHRIGRLKDVKRSGWCTRNIHGPESVADHSFRTALLALVLTDGSKLDKNKCIQMALIHDLGESLIGDITPLDNMSEEKKHYIEMKAIKTLIKDIGPTEILDLWSEYECRQSPEAKFVYELDRIEMLLQALEYEKKYAEKNIDFSDFWINVKKDISNPQILKIFKILKKARSN